MKRASISELKTSLSADLHVVKRGEEVFVTERGRPIARLVPAVGAELASERKRRLIRTGIPSWASWLSTPLTVTRISQTEVVAVSRICTHQGCTVALPNAPGASLDCPCHGSRFTTAGQVVNGPRRARSRPSPPPSAGARS